MVEWMDRKHGWLNGQENKMDGWMERKNGWLDDQKNRGMVELI